MDTKKFIKIIQEVVRNEVRETIRNEVRNILKEELSKQPLKEQYNPTINSLKKNLKPKSTGNALQDILNETAYEGEWKTMGGGTYGAEQAMTFNWQQQMMNEYGESTAPVAKGGIENFIQANNNGAQDIRQVQVNAVPDFSDMMKVMKNKGML